MLSYRGGAGLLDVDEDLGALIASDHLESARRGTLLSEFKISQGTCRLENLSLRTEVRGAVLGVVVARGLLIESITIDGRLCSRMLTAGSIVWLDGAREDTLAGDTFWTALEVTRILVLDDHG